jgi:hypothetical protein
MYPTERVEMQLSLNLQVPVPTYPCYFFLAEYSNSHADLIEKAVLRILDHKLNPEPNAFDNHSIRN